jgi:hypothetical protein
LTGVRRRRGERNVWAGSPDPAAARAEIGAAVDRLISRLRRPAQLGVAKAGGRM